MDSSTPRPHPSNPIPNAAYPDSSYRPPNLALPHLGHDRDAEEKIFVPGGPPSPYSDLPEVAPSSTTASLPLLHASSVVGGAGQASSSAVSPLSPNPPASSSASTFSRPNKPPTLWGPDSLLAMNPNLPPPPYSGPSRPGTSHSVHSHSHHDGPPSPNPSQLSHAPLRPFTPVGAGVGLLRPDSSSSSPLRPPQPLLTHARPGHMGGGGEGGGGGAGIGMNGGRHGHHAFGGFGDLGPVSMERKRRQRRLKMCLWAFAALSIFLVALIVGIAVGVIKMNADRRERLPPPPPPPLPPPPATSA